MKKLLITLVALSVSQIACSPVEYKRPTGSSMGNQGGFLDEEVKPGLHVIEVQQIGGYQFIFNNEETKKTFISHWKRRASELCPAGYVGEPEWIQPIDAKIERFRCTLLGCQDYPMLSGYARCSRS